MMKYTTLAQWHSTLLTGLTCACFCMHDAWLCQYIICATVPTWQTSFRKKTRYYQSKICSESYPFLSTKRETLCEGPHKKRLISAQKCSKVGHLKGSQYTNQRGT